MNDQLERTAKHVGRRAVVRTAAHAAWAVPAIQIATSVSANAAVCSANTSALADFTITSGGVNYTGNTMKVAHGVYYFKNDGKAGSAILRIQLNQATVVTAPAVTSESGGTTWSAATAVPNTPNAWTYTRSIGACATGSQAIFAKNGFSADNMPTWTVTVSP